MAHERPFIERFPLPDIDNDDLRSKVFTHRSMTGAPAGQQYNGDIPQIDNERLVFVGAGVIHLIVMATIEEVLPLSRRGEMTDKKTLLVAQSRLAGWSDTYNLPSRLRAHPSQEETVRRNEWAKAQVFQAYVGALFKEHGYEFVDEWFGEIVEHTINEVLELEQAALVEAFDRTTIGMPGTRDDHRPSSSSFSENDTPSTSNPNMHDRESPFSPGGFSAQGASPPTRRNSGGVPENNANPQSPLSKFNQRCAQKHIQPRWAFSHEGPQHGPRFRATVTLPGEPEPIGLGEGPTKAAAKQLAAEMALCILDEA